MAARPSNRNCPEEGDRRPQESCIVKRNWILGGYSAQYTHASDLNPLSLSLLVDQLLLTIYDELGLKGDAGEMLDCKGRNQGDVLLPEIPTPHRDEIFRVGGEIATGQQGQHFEWSPFEATCHAEFIAFEGTHHIRHSLRVQRGNCIPEWLPWRLLGQAAPIRPSYFRLGLEHFQSRFTFASFGYLPQVTDSILIDATRTDLSIQVTTEQRRWKMCDPFREIPLFLAIHEALKTSCNFDLAASFHECLIASGRL